MKEVKEPVVGNILQVRYNLEVYGVITEVFYDKYGLNIKMEWITDIDNEEGWQRSEDAAYPMNLNTPNYYIYLDLKDTPQNRLLLRLKYGQ